jgi:acyl carrier protein
MNQAEILARLQTIFNDIFLEPPTIAPALSAHDVPEWDSLMQISLLVAVEKSFNIRFHVGEVEATANVGEWADLISRRMTEK